MTTKVDEPLSTGPVVGTPARPYARVFEPGTEVLASGELRVTVLGSGDPWVRRSQASGSLLVEVGNPEQDYFFFDLGSGALANFTALGLPVEASTRVFLSHLHADHIGDIPGLLGSLAKAGRVDRVETLGWWQRGPRAGTRGLRRAHGQGPRLGHRVGPRRAPHDRLRGDRPRDPLRPARHHLRAQRRGDLELPGHPRPERRAGLHHRLRRPEGRLLGRHAALPPRRGSRARRGPPDPRVLPIPRGLRACHGPLARDGRAAHEARPHGPRADGQGSSIVRGHGWQPSGTST